MKGIDRRRREQEIWSIDRVLSKLALPQISSRLPKVKCFRAVCRSGGMNICCMTAVNDWQEVRSRLQRGHADLLHEIVQSID